MTPTEFAQLVDKYGLTLATKGFNWYCALFSPQRRTELFKKGESVSTIIKHESDWNK